MAFLHNFIYKHLTRSNVSFASRLLIKDRITLELFSVDKSTVVNIKDHLFES
jgi:hypothetical protein